MYFSKRGNTRDEYGADFGQRKICIKHVKVEKKKYFNLIKHTFLIQFWHITIYYVAYYCILLYITVYYCILLYTTVYYCRLLYLGTPHKITFGWAFGSSRHIINTQIINPPGPVLVSTHGKATKSFFVYQARLWERLLTSRGLPGKLDIKRHSPSVL